MASFLETETMQVAHYCKVKKLLCRSAPSHDSCEGRKSVNILEAFHDGILLNIQERLANPLDLQAWVLSCKRFYGLESGSRTRLSVLRLHTFPALARRYPSLTHLDLSSCTFVSDEGLGCVAQHVGKRLVWLNLSTVRTFSNLGLLLLAQECTSLLHLDLTKCLQIGDLAMMALAQVHSLQSLNLYGCFEVSDSGIAVLAYNCRRLRSLCLKWCCQLRDDALFAIGTYCLDLQELDVSYTEISGDGLFSIGKLSSLHTLHMAACSALTDEGLIYLKDGSKSLQVLNVSRCRNISYQGIMKLVDAGLPLKDVMMSYCYLVADPLLHNFEKFKSLLSLRLDGCDMSAFDLHFTRNWCKNLEELSLSKCKWVKDLSISAVVEGCSNLKNIDLTCCKKITDRVLSSIATTCKGLVRLKLESCNNFSQQGLQILCSSCKLLEEMDVTDSNLNDAGLMAIAQCKRLRSLKLGVCENIHDVGLSYIASSCLDLRELDIYRSAQISDIGISAICGRCTKLTSLNLSYCTQITDGGLFALANLPELRILELRGCIKLLSHGLFSVAKNCRNLMELDLKRCTSIEEYVPLVISQYCKNLRKVNLSYCPATEEGIMALARGRCMQNMKLVHVGNVSVRGFAKLLLVGQSLKKVQLLVHLRHALPQQVIEEAQKRGCKFKWVEKL